MRKKTYILIITAVFLFSASASLAAPEKFPLVAQGEYFSIYAPDGLDMRELLARLNYRHFLQVDSFLDTREDDPRDLLSKTLDALYLQASDVLGIHIYSFHGVLEIFPDKIALHIFFKDFLNMDLEAPSYYLHETGTVYISYKDLTLGMLGHEIAHAIISNYFVVLPSAQVQEILSGYVEYSLRKQTMTLLDPPPSF